MRFHRVKIAAVGSGNNGGLYYLMENLIGRGKKTRLSQKKPEDQEN
jgi:hypothetical protein